MIIPKNNRQLCKKCGEAFISISSTFHLHYTHLWKITFCVMVIHLSLKKTPFFIIFFHLDYCNYKQLTYFICLFKKNLFMVSTFEKSRAAQITFNLIGQINTKEQRAANNKKIMMYTDTWCLRK